MRALTLLGVAVLVLSANAAAQQTGATLTSSSRVRITAPSLFPRPLIGRVIYLGDTSLTVLEDGAAAARAIPTDAIRRLDVSTGTRRRPGLGAAIGAPLGAALAVAAGPIVPSGGGGLAGCCGRTGEVVMDVAIGGAIGAFIGGSIGWYTHTERWERTVVVSLRF
jgi:hypothetical protein